MTRHQRIDIGRFAASVVALMLLVVVVPIGLGVVTTERFGAAHPFAGVRPPWTWSTSEVVDTLAHQLNDDSVIEALLRASVCVVWLAVIVMAATTVVETIHMVRHRGVAMPPVRGVGWAQGIARYIAVGLIVVMPLASVKPSLATTRTSAVGGTPAGVELVERSRSPGTGVSSAALTSLPAPDSASPASNVPVPFTTYIVRRGDSVFSIAAELADHDERRTMVIANEILDANLDSSMNDGQRFTNPAYIEPGWALVIPSGAVGDAMPAPPLVQPAQAGEVLVGSSYVVESGDSLWAIADEQLGSGTQWLDIWDANAGHDMGDGRTFDDPDLIMPGWELALPDEGGSGPTSVETEPIPLEQSPSVEGQPDPALIPSVDSAGEPAIEQRVDGTAEPGGTVIVTSAAPATTATPSTPGTLTTTAAVPATGRSDPAIAAATPPTSTTMVPADVGAGSAGTPPERGIAPDAPSPIRFEHAAMLAAGILAVVGVRRRQRLRAARPRSRVPEPRPDLIETERLLRRIDAGERATRIDVACRAAAFELIDTGVQIVVAQVSAEGEIVLTLSGRASAPSPWSCTDSMWTLPAAIPIELLSEAARRVGMPCVALVQLGIDDDGNDVLIDLEACGTLVIDAHPSQADAVVRALATGLATSLYAEVAHLITVSLPNDVLLGHRNAHQTDSIDAAFDLAAALVGTTSTNERSSFELRSLRTGGEMWEPAVILLDDADHAGAESIADHRPRPGHGIGLVATVGAGELDDAPARVVGETDRWNLVVAGRTIPMTPIGLDRVDIDAVVAVLRDAEQPLIWMDDVTGCAPGTGELVPFEPMEHSVVVNLLGGVTVTDCAGTPGQFDRSKTVELIAWLATHRHHSTRGAARTALWELDVRDATFANVVSEARRALGRLVAPPDGEEWLARTLTEQLPLHSLVVTDAQLIEERLEQARLEPPAQAIETLRPAVARITGMPFADTGYLWPDAEGITSNLVLLIIGASAELAGHALSIGDTELVFWATGQGLAVLPGHEELIAFRMRAHARSGDLAGIRQEWESYERIIVADAWSDGEPAPKLLALRRELLAQVTD